METTIKPTTIAQQVERLNKIHGMIESCKSRIRINYEMCEAAYGVNDSGNVICYEDDLRFMGKYSAIAKRLKRAYNNQLKNMKPYSI